MRWFRSPDGADRRRHADQAAANDRRDHLDRRRNYEDDGELIRETREEYRVAREELEGTLPNIRHAR